MIYGYARINTQHQSFKKQKEALVNYGCSQIFEEIGSGTSKDQPKLEEMLTCLKQGDNVVVCSLDRISRDAKHLIELVENFKKNQIEFISINDNIDTSTHIGEIVLKIKDIISNK